MGHVTATDRASRALTNLSKVDLTLVSGGSGRPNLPICPPQGRAPGEECEPLPE